MGRYRVPWRTCWIKTVPQSRSHFFLIVDETSHTWETDPTQNAISQLDRHDFLCSYYVSLLSSNQKVDSTRIPGGITVRLTELWRVREGKTLEYTRSSLYSARGALTAAEYLHCPSRYIKVNAANSGDANLVEVSEF